jgi:hypothetical protein
MPYLFSSLIFEVRFEGMAYVQRPFNFKVRLEGMAYV